MKNVFVGMIVFAAATASAIAAPQVRGVPKVTKIPPVLVLRPDFAVQSIAPVTDFQNNLKAVTVTIVNLCTAVKSSAPYVTVTVTDPANGAGGAVVGYNAAPFLTGEKSATQLVDLGKTLKPGLTIRVTVNEDKAVPEAWSGNNSRQINPNVAPFPPGKDYCQPANYE